MKNKCRFLSVLSLFILCLFLAACGPSDEKIAMAQQKYTELAKAHNDVADARSAVTDSSLDSAISALQEKVAIIEEYNLQEMNDEEIDLLIQTMDRLIASYAEYCSTLIEIKMKEDDAVLTPVPITVTNGTGLTFTSLSLYQQDSRGIHTNVLDSLSPLVPSQTLTGLVIQRNKNNTPWVLMLEDETGVSYEIILPVEEYDEEGESLTLTEDEETKGIKAGEPAQNLLDKEDSIE